jgi:hypothetical protein
MSVSCLLCLRPDLRHNVRIDPTPDLVLDSRRLAPPRIPLLSRRLHRESPLPRFMVPSLDCPVVEIEPHLVLDDRHAVNVVLVGFHPCWVIVCLFVGLFICLFGCRLELDLELDLEIALAYKRVHGYSPLSWLPLASRLSPLASRIPHLVPRHFVPRPRRYLVISLLRCYRFRFVFQSLSLRFCLRPHLVSDFFSPAWSNSKGGVQRHVPRSLHHF